MSTVEVRPDIALTKQLVLPTAFSQPMPSFCWFQAKHRKKPQQGCFRQASEVEKNKIKKKKNI